MTVHPTDRMAIVLLNPRGLKVARKVQAAWPGCEIHGLADRVADADSAFSDFTECLHQLYRERTPIVGVCALGILGRSLAPLLSDKQAEPPVLAMSDDGEVIVPFLGGLTGANEMARALAEVTGGAATITASGSREFGLQLEAPPEGYVLANPEDAKGVTSDLLAGKTARLEGSADFLMNSRLPLDDAGEISIRVTTTPSQGARDALIFHPQTTVVHLDADALVSEILDGPSIQAVLEETFGVAKGTIGAVALTEGCDIGPDAWRAVKQFADECRARVRYISEESGLRVLGEGTGFKVLEAATPDEARNIGRANGSLIVVGLGPGDPGYLTQDAKEALARADDIVGYETYVNLVPKIGAHQQTHASGNRVEIERAEQALDLAVQGRRVALVTSGDPGIFAMASAVLEALEAKPRHWNGLDVTILPGISAMQTAAARIGAPIGHDFCTISLSDIRKPWDIVAKRLRAAGEADFVIALYNPASKTRREQIHQTKEVLLGVKSPYTLVVLGRNLGRPGETVEVTTLGDLDPDSIDMRTVLVIGSSRTRSFDGPGGQQMVYTPRTYDVE